MIHFQVNEPIALQTFCHAPSELRQDLSGEPGVIPSPRRGPPTWVRDWDKVGEIILPSVDRLGQVAARAAAEITLLGMASDQ